MSPALCLIDVHSDTCFPETGFYLFLTPKEKHWNERTKQCLIQIAFDASRSSSSLHKEVLELPLGRRLGSNVLCGASDISTLSGSSGQFLSEYHPLLHVLG